ncbi:hypothetical protein K438DRAFT_1933068 [Mycena galopus ATCC 62051]|nr:hypothetical protein K438DRAFT_1933068 [Mycena galopus ATCC 62051]
MESVPSSVSFIPHLARIRIEELDRRIPDLKSHDRDTTGPETPAYDLRWERHPLQTRLAAYVYPILNLPHEITSEIFVQSLDPDDASPSSPSSPLFLGHVCHEWREIALSTPCLWATLDLYSKTVEANERCLCLIPLWLTRFRQYPLHISMVHKPHAPSLLKSLDAIVPHSKQWQELDAQLTSLTLPVLFLHPFWETLSATTQVEYLAIHVISWLDNNEAEFLPKIPPLLHLHSLEILAPPGFKPNPKGHFQLLNQLTLPALRGFQFPEASFPATSIPAIKSLIARSGIPANCLDIFVEDAEHSTQYYRSRFPDINALVVNSVDNEDEDVEDSDTGSSTDTDTEGDDGSPDTEEGEDSE